MITLSLQTVFFFPCLLVWHKFLLKTGHVVLDNRKLVKRTLSIWFYIYLADRCVGLMYTLDLGARNFIFLCCLLFCLCCELWISQVLASRVRVHLEVLSSIIQSHHWHFSFSRIHTKHVRTSYWPHLEHTSSLIFPVSTLVCYQYLLPVFLQQLLNRFYYSFSLSFEADIYLPSGLLSALRLTTLYLRILNWLMLCCPLGSTWQRSPEGSQWEKGHCRGLLVS